ncbi:hypothetical protein ACWCRD_01715 [Streptomyces sp. NPDC002092]
MGTSRSISSWRIRFCSLRRIPPQPLQPGPLGFAQPPTRRRLGTLIGRRRPVAESWFNKWRDKPTTARELRYGQPADVIRHIFEGSGGTCGSPKVWLLLVRAAGGSR